MRAGRPSGRARPAPAAPAARLGRAAAPRFFVDGLVEYNVGYDSPWSQDSPALQPQCTIQRSSWVPEAAPRCTVQPQHSSPIAPFRRAPGSLRVVPAGPHCTVLGRAGGVFDNNFWDEFPMRLVRRHSAPFRCWDGSFRLAPIAPFRRVHC